jgi:hypothetical protein
MLFEVNLLLLLKVTVPPEQANVSATGPQSVAPGEKAIERDALFEPAWK